MERTGVVKQIAVEILTEMDQWHDKQGRFTSKADAVVRDFDPQLAHGLRAGETPKVIGHTRINGIVLKDAVVGMAKNGHRFVRGVDDRGKVQHIAIGNEYKTQHKVPRRARPSEIAAVAHAHAEGKMHWKDRRAGVDIKKPEQPLNVPPQVVKPPKPPAWARPPLPQTGQGTMTRQPQAVPDETQSGSSPLLHSKVSDMKHLGGGIHESYVATLEDGTKAVWKPVEGYEKTRGDHRKEAATYDMAKVLGMEHLVPETVVRTINGKTGSLMQFVEATNASRFREEKRYDGERDLALGAAFDCLICNTDRHTNNWMLDAKENLHLIDHGYSLHGDDYSTARSSGLVREAINRKLPLQPIQEAWGNKWPNLESALKKQKISAPAIEQAKTRYFDLMQATSFEAFFKGKF